MRFIERDGLAVAAYLRAEAVSPTLTRFIGTMIYTRPAEVVGVELWRGPECLNAQGLDSIIHAQPGGEVVIHLHLQHSPGRVDLWAWAEVAQPPKFTTVEEAQAWLDARS